MPDPREPLAKIVRDTWVATARELLDDPKPSWVVPWDELADPFQREADMRIGAVVAAAERARIWARPVRQRLELREGAWRCAGCLAELTESVITHEPRCSEMHLDALIGHSDD